MNDFRDSCWQLLAIATLVAGGFWLADHPQVAERVLIETAGESPSDDDTVCIRRIAWLPDGDRLLTWTSAASNPDPLILHDWKRDLHRPVEGPEDAISALSLASDGRHALLATFTGQLWWLDLDSRRGSARIELPFPTAITAAALSHNGLWVAVALDSGQVLLIPTPPESSLATKSADHRTIETSELPIANHVVLASGLKTCSCDVQFSQTDDRLLCAGNDGSIRVWDVESRRLLQTLRTGDAVVTAAVFLPCDDQILSASLDDTIRLWDLVSGRETWRRPCGQLGITALALSPDGTTVAWAGYNRTIHVWNVEQERMEHEISISAPAVWGLQFSPDGASLAVSGRGPLVRIYDWRATSLRQEFDVREI